MPRSSLSAIYCAISHGWLLGQNEKEKQLLTAKKYFRRTGDSRNKQSDRHAKEIFHLVPSICSIIVLINRLIALTTYPSSLLPSLPQCTYNHKELKIIENRCLTLPAQSWFWIFLYLFQVFWHTDVAKFRRQTQNAFVHLRFTEDQNPSSDFLVINHTTKKLPHFLNLCYSHIWDL